MLEPVANIKPLLIEGCYSKLLPQSYRNPTLVTVKKFYGRHHDHVDPFDVGVSTLISDLIASVEV